MSISSSKPATMSRGCSPPSRQMPNMTSLAIPRGRPSVARAPEPSTRACSKILSESAVETKRRLYGDSFLVDESLWRGRAPGSPFGVEGKNRPLEFRLLHVVEFADDGNIKRENVWIDFAAIIQQLPQD